MNVQMIKTTRKLLGLSQQDLADELGCSRELVSCYENRMNAPEPFLEACRAYFKKWHKDIIAITSQYGEK